MLTHITNLFRTVCDYERELTKYVISVLPKLTNGYSYKPLGILSLLAYVGSDSFSHWYEKYKGNV